MLTLNMGFGKKMFRLSIFFKRMSLETKNQISFQELVETKPRTDADVAPCLLHFKVVNC